jgi:two-component system OmpR family sensor kinase
MAQAPTSAGFWQSLRELPGRTPLRVKLMTAVLALVAIALVVISVAGLQILKTNLLGPYDSTLEANIGGGGAASRVGDYLQNGTTIELPSQAVDWIPQNGNVHQVVQPVRDLQLGLQGPSGPPMSPPAVSSDPAWIAAHLNHPFTLNSQSGGTKWRVLMQRLPQANGTVAYAIDASSVYSTTGKLATIDLLVSLAVIALIGILGIGLIRASLRALTDVERTAGAIAAGDLSKRVPERDPRTEMGRLGRSLNAMLSQIESAFQSQSRSEAAAKRSEERMRQFVADASHELRTPLTAIRGFAEYYRQRGGIAVGDAGPEASSLASEPQPADGATQAGEQAPAGAAANGDRRRGARKLAPVDMDRIMRRVEQESARMGILVEDMLLLARLDQQRPLMESPVDLLTLAADAVHDARVVAPARSINLTVSSSRALLVIGDEVRLRQVIGNLMSNALTHTPDGTPIDVVIRSGNLDEAAPATAIARPDVAEGSLEDEPAAGDMHWGADHVPPPPGAPAPSSPTGSVLAGRVPGGPAAVLEVTDHGPGLSAEQAEHVFERFYRADPARTTGGTGLGLAIVAALVAAHGGIAWVQSRPGEGATFCIALPLAPEATQAPEDDFDGGADDIAAEAGTVESGTGENGPAESGVSDGTSQTEPTSNEPTGDDASEGRFNEARTGEPGTAYTPARGLS